MQAVLAPRGWDTEIDSQSDSVQRDLIGRMKEGDSAAEECLILANIQFVGSMARRYGNIGGNEEDLFQVGSLRLRDAGMDFDPALHTSFRTYAFPRVRGAIIGESKLATLIQVPANLQGQIDGIQALYRQSLDMLTSHVPSKTIRKELGVTRHALELAIARAESAQIALSSKRQIFMKDQPLTDRDEEPDTLAIMNESDDDIKKAIGLLPDIERQAVRLRFGFGCGEHTLEQVATILGIGDRKDAFRVVSRALGKMKKTVFITRHHLQD